ncbi:MAG TPA: hypothetical protein VFK40_08930 [Nitrososphaeraceae archaeon]|nr:hypothetical protein [Nitrososphaeraceae archaeon]
MLLNYYSYNSYSLNSLDRKVIFDNKDANLFIDSTGKPYYNKEMQDEAVDIESVNLFSNGHILNATLWIGKPIPEEKTLLENKISNLIYGILIDSDLDPLTGKDGIDYQLELQWNNINKTWVKMLGEYSSTNSFRVFNYNNNYTNFYGKALDPLTKKSDHGYVLLSLNLDDLKLLDKYNIIFYSQKISNYNNFEIYEFDFTSPITIPSPQFTFILSEDNKIVKQGESKTLTVQLKSNLEDLSQHVIINPAQSDPSIKLIPLNNNINSNINIKPLEIKIEVAKNAEVGDHIIPISLNYTLDSIEQGARFLNLQYYEPSFQNSSGYINSKSNITFSVIEPPNFLTTFYNAFEKFWNVFGDLVSLLGGGFMGGVSALVLDKYKQKDKSKK